MRVLKYTSVWLMSLLIAITISFLLQRKLGLLNPSHTLESLAMRVAAWPLLIWTAVATLTFSVHSVRADIRTQKQQAEQKQADMKAQQEQHQQQLEKDHREFAIALVGAQLTTTLFDQTKPVAYYLSPMLEQFKPYGKRPKGVFAPAIAYFSDKKEPTMERRFVLYLTQLGDKLVWPFRFPALHKDYLYKGLGRIWGEPQQRIPQFITLPKEFEIKEPERVAAVEKGLDDPAIPQDLSDEKKSPLDPPAWRWLWRYVGNLSAYTNYPTTAPLDEMHLQFAHAGGYDSIKNAFAYIEKNPPTQTDHPMVWTLSVDAPEFPKTETDRNANDSGTLLMWSHPQADTGRKPLVWLQRPVTFIERDGKPLRLAHVQETIAAALHAARITLDDVGYLITDFGIGKPGDDYAGQIGSAFTPLAAEPQHSIDLLLNRTDLTASLTDIGANTAGFSSLLAAWAAFAKNQPSVLIGRPSPTRIDVLIFKPRANHVAPPHDKAYFGAVAEPEFSRPWWGERLDGKPDFGDEPGKERLDGKGLVDPEGPFEFTWQ